MSLFFPFGVLIFIFWASVYVSHNYSPRKVYWFFEFCHLSAGFFVTAFLANFFGSTSATITGTFIVGGLWELWEYSRIHWRFMKKLMDDWGLRGDGKMSWPDTMLDLLLDVLGAVLYVHLIVK